MSTPFSICAPVVSGGGTLRHCRRGLTQTGPGVDKRGDPDLSVDGIFGSVEPYVSGRIRKQEVPVYYRSRVTDQLTKKEMERARRAFIGLLQRRGYSWRFIEENGEELLAIAHTEFARALDKGVDVEEPVAWTVNCAWRRTQNLHTAEGRRPPSVSTENLLELVDEGAPDPEEIVEEAERARKIREAVAELNEAQRQVIALTYFEGMSVREAARRLGWHASKAQYAHKTAIKSLFEHLGVTSSDQLTVEIGLAAFLTKIVAQLDGTTFRTARVFRHGIETPRILGAQGLELASQPPDFLFERFGRNQRPNRRIIELDETRFRHGREKGRRRP